MIGTESSLQYGNLQEDPSGLSTAHGADKREATHEVSSSPAYVLNQASSPQTSNIQTCPDESRAALIRNFAAKVGGYGGFHSVSDYYRETVESTTHPSSVELPMRIVRIPNRRCPVHFQSDQHIFGLRRNYHAISVSNCWQGLKTTSSSNSPSAKPISLMIASPRTLLQGNSSSMCDPTRTSYGEFLGPVVDFVAWTSIVMICGFIFFYQARGFEY